MDFENHKPYRFMPKVRFNIHEVCSMCQHAIVNLGPFDTHADICEYLHFRDILAPSLGLKEVNNRSDGYYIKILLETLGIEHRVFKLSGMGGHGYEIFLKEELAVLIDLYYVKEGYAGMTLEEYITVVTNAQS